MPIKVLVVDDSSFFRRQIARMLESDAGIQVVGTAVDGKDAVAKTLELKPEVITMDVEMPVLNGIEATRQIMQQRATPILMFSSITTDGAKATLDALDAGAVDFLPKRFEDIARDKKEVERVLCERVKAIAKRPRTLARPAVTPTPRPAMARATMPPSAAAGRISRTAKGHIKLLAIGTSTGGPLALQEVLTKLPANFPTPILLVQHMPGSFTPAFAQRLDSVCAIKVKEAADGDRLEAGVAYLAPGGKQMTVRRRGELATLHIEEALATQTYKPCVDITYTSLAEQYRGEVLAVILTGMGADGCEGSKKLKSAGSIIWAQDEATSTVYGMPAAVAEAGIVDRILPLGDMGSNIVQQVM